MLHKRFNFVPGVLLFATIFGHVAVTAVAMQSETGQKRRVFYVRQTVGHDTNDGRSAQTAWGSISKLSTLEAGDTAIVGPGLYREMVLVRNSGTAEARIRFIADSAGRYTGDPPGIVMITGADPVDERLFEAHSEPGVYVFKLSDPRRHVLSVVEMDGEQYRYTRARDTRLHLIEKLSELEVVFRTPSSFFYDKEGRAVFIHTSDGKSPMEHEIEFMHRGAGISMSGPHFVSVIGFTFRHMGDAGINFFRGSGDGIAINNTSYGNRQGIRVYDAPNVLVMGNTLFRNDNCGVYFARGSTQSWAIGNILYENIKGVRWSSDSVNGLSINNLIFDNHEAGIAVESGAYAVLSGNTVVNNTKYQLLVGARGAGYLSEGNCFLSSEQQLTADLFQTQHHKSLAEYQRSFQQDLSSREGECGSLPTKIDVRELHSKTTSYVEHARKILNVEP